MVNKEKQIKNSFIYMLPTIVSDLLPFVTLPIFTRILSIEDYGLLALVTIYGLFASGLANFGMTSTYGRNYFQYKDDQEKTGALLYSITGFVFINFIAIFATTYLIRTWLSQLLTGSDANGNLILWAYAAYFFYNVSTKYYLTYLKNIENASEYSYYKIISRLLTFFLSLLFITVFQWGILGIIKSQLIAGIIVFILLTYKFYGRHKISFDKALLIDSIKISYPLTPRIFLGVISTQFDKYMINLLDTLGGTGIYHLGKKISEVVFTATTALQNVFNPQVYQFMFDDETNGGDHIGKYLTPFIYISSGIAMIISLGAEEIVTLLTAPEYHGAVEIVMVLSLYYAFLFFGKITGLQLIFKRKTHITSLLSIVAILINIGLNIPLIMTFGAIGAAWATLVAAVISGVISIKVAQKYYKISWEYRKIILIYLTLFGSSILLIIMRVEQVDYYIRVLSKISVVGLFLLYGYKIKVISLENLRLIKKMITRNKA
jgi:O-antigen/teichoic acid export membrane protein